MSFSTPPPPARRWYRLGLPIWAVLAAAQAMLLMGFGTGQVGFPRTPDKKVLDTPLAWSIAVHRSAAAVLLGVPAVETAAATEWPETEQPQSLDEATTVAGFAGSGRREWRRMDHPAAKDPAELLQEIVVLTPDPVP